MVQISGKTNNDKIKWNLHYQKYKVRTRKNSIKIFQNCIFGLNSVKISST